MNTNRGLACFQTFMQSCAMEKVALEWNGLTSRPVVSLQLMDRFPKHSQLPEWHNLACLLMAHIAGGLGYLRISRHGLGVDFYPCATRRQF